MGKIDTSAEPGGKAPGKSGQDRRRDPSRHGRPLSLNTDVREIARCQRILTEKPGAVKALR